MGWKNSLKCSWNEKNLLALQVLFYPKGVLYSTQSTVLNQYCCINSKSNQTVRNCWNSVLWFCSDTLWLSWGKSAMKEVGCYSIHVSSFSLLLYFFLPISWASIQLPISKSSFTQMLLASWLGGLLELIIQWNGLSLDEWKCWGPYRHILLLTDNCEEGIELETNFHCMCGTELIDADEFEVYVIVRQFQWWLSRKGQIEVNDSCLAMAV